MPKPIGAGKVRKSDTPRTLFGAAITQLRVQRKESQAAVADRVGCDVFYLRNIEQGKENLTFDIMYAIIVALEMLPLSRFWHFAEEYGSRLPLSTS